MTGRDLGGMAGPQHSIEFNGSNQLVDFGNVAQLNGATRYSISVWAKFDRASNYDTVYGKRVSDDDRATLLQAWQGKDVSVAVSSGYFHTASPARSSPAAAITTRPSSTEACPPTSG